MVTHKYQCTKHIENKNINIFGHRVDASRTAHSYNTSICGYGDSSFIKHTVHTHHVDMETPVT